MPLGLSSCQRAYSHKGHYCCTYPPHEQVCYPVARMNPHRLIAAMDSYFSPSAPVSPQIHLMVIYTRGPVAVMNPHSPVATMFPRISIAAKVDPCHCSMVVMNPHHSPSARMFPHGPVAGTSPYGAPREITSLWILLRSHMYPRIVLSRHLQACALFSGGHGSHTIMFKPQAIISGSHGPRTMMNPHRSPHAYMFPHTVLSRHSQAHATMSRRSPHAYMYPRLHPRVHMNPHRPVAMIYRHLPPKMIMYPRAPVTAMKYSRHRSTVQMDPPPAVFAVPYPYRHLQTMIPPMKNGYL